MRRSDKILGVVAATLFICAGVAWQRSLHIIHQYHWIVLEQPIRLENGFSISHPFTVDVAAKYWVELECRKTVSSGMLEEILSKKLAAEYAVTSRTDRIASGDTSEERGMSFSEEYMSRIIATFDATPGIPYNLALRITTGFPELATTRPTVKVSVDPIVYKQAFVPAALLAYLTVGLALAGLLCLLPVAWHLLFRPK